VNEVWAGINQDLRTSDIFTVAYVNVMKLQNYYIDGVLGSLQHPFMIFI